MAQFNMQEILLSLRSSSRAAKLKGLSALLEGINHIQQLAELDLNALVETLTALFKDPSEAIQQSAIKALCAFVSQNVDIGFALPNLLNLLLLDFEPGKQTGSEEIRLLEVNLLHQLIRNKGSSMKYYSEEALRICESGLKDSFCEIRIAISRCLTDFIPLIKAEFLTKSDSIIDTLLSTFTHNQYRVRCAHTELLGQVLLHGNYKRVSDVWRSLAQRVIDSHHAVRLSVFRVLYLLMTEFHDRYSHWNRFVPLFLCGLFDEISDLQQQCATMWTEIGEQFANENREDAKNQELLDSQITLNYPANLQRPSVGCRMLVKRVVYNVLQSNLNDLKDWQDTVRIQAIRLLRTLIFHSEYHITIGVDKVIHALCQAAKDENRVVVEEVKECAHLLGYFVEVHTLCPLLIPRVEDAGHLVVLNGILEVVKPADVAGEMVSIVSALHRMSLTKLIQQQYYTLSCARNIIGRMLYSNSEWAFQLFHVLINHRGLCCESGLQSMVKDAMKEFAEHFDVEGTVELYEKFAPQYFQSLSDSECQASDWTSASFEFDIFSSFILTAGLGVFHENFILIRPVLLRNIAPQKGVELRAKIYLMLIELFEKWRTDSGNPEKTANIRGDFDGSSLVMNLILPNLEWRTGRPESALRMLCVSCLAVILDGNFIQFNKILKSAVLPKVLSLARDERPQTHTAVVRILRRFIEHSDFSDVLPQVSSALLKGLDDEKRVRCEAFAGIQALMQQFAQKPDQIQSRSQLIQDILSTCLIHLDDTDEEICLAAIDCLLDAQSCLDSHFPRFLSAVNMSFHNLDRFDSVKKRLNISRMRSLEIE